MCLRVNDAFERQKNGFEKKQCLTTMFCNNRVPWGPDHERGWYNSHPQIPPYGTGVRPLDHPMFLIWVCPYRGYDTRGVRQRAFVGTHSRVVGGEGPGPIENSFELAQLQSQPPPQGLGFWGFRKCSETAKIPPSVGSTKGKKTMPSVLMLWNRWKSPLRFFCEKNA